MSEYNYGNSAPGELNVGWLGIGRPFFTGRVDPDLRNVLLEMARDPVDKMRGFHDCEFCDVKSPIIIPGSTESTPAAYLGNGEIRVRGENVAYRAPTLIVHYIDAHGYLPPMEFLDALRRLGGLSQGSRSGGRGRIGRGMYPGYRDRASRTRELKESARKEGASVLLRPLMLLAADANEQVEVLAVRAEEPDLSDLDVVREFSEDLSTSMELAMPFVGSSKLALAGLSEVASALSDSSLGREVASLHTDSAWARVRKTADRALRALIVEGVVPDAIPFRLYPGRFASALQPVIGLIERWPTINLSQAQVDRFVAAWAGEIPPATPNSEVEPFAIEMAARRIYAEHPEILKFLGFNGSRAVRGRSLPSRFR